MAQNQTAQIAVSNKAADTQARQVEVTAAQAHIDLEGRKTTVLNWLKTPIRELANQAPLQLFDTVTGFGLVDDVLGRIDYGIPA